MAGYNDDPGTIKALESYGDLLKGITGVNPQGVQTFNPNGGQTAPLGPDGKPMRPTGSSNGWIDPHSASHNVSEVGNGAGDRAGDRAANRQADASNQGLYDKPVGTGGGVAGNQRTYNPISGLYNGNGVLDSGGGNAAGLSSISGTANYFRYADPTAFYDPNAANIYNVINNQINGRSNMSAPTADRTKMGGAYTFNGQQIGPVAAANGAQMSPQMMVNGAQLDTSRDQQYAGAQDAYINALARQSQGQGPSVAQTAAKQQGEQAQAQMMAALGSQRGSGSAALGQRAAQMQGAQGMQAAASQGALGRSQEALSAQQNLGSALGGARGQTQTTAQTQAQLAQQALMANQGAFNNASQQQAQLAQQSGQYNASAYNAQALQQAQMMQQAQAANAGARNQFGLQQGQMDQAIQLANQQAQLQQTGMNNQQYSQGLGSFIQQDQSDIQSQAAFEQLLSQQQEAILSLNAGRDVANTQTALQLAGAGASAVGSLFGMSDETVKTEIRSGEADLRGFLALYSLGAAAGGNR